MLASEIIREGKEAILANGHYQGDFAEFDMAGDLVGLCLLGSVRYAEQTHYGLPDNVDFDVECHADRFLCDALGVPEHRVGWDNKTIDRSYVLVEWQDHPSTVVNEVIDLLDRAEKLALIDEQR